MTRRIFVIRHGDTFESSASARRIGAGTDIPLVENGRVQADRLGRWFAAEGVVIARLLSGPLLRARETAGRIGAVMAHPPDGVAPWLNEIDHGPDEGRTEAQVLARIGAPALAAWDERGIAPPGWCVDADRRIDAWRGFFEQPGAGTDLLVTSNGAARFALLALGLPLASLKLRTGAFGELAVDPGGAVRLIRWDERPVA